MRAPWSTPKVRASVQAATGEAAPTLPGALLAGLSDFVAVRLGLHFPEPRWRDLQRGITAAAAEFGFADGETCARWLLTASPKREHIDVLASHLTVGETYFFREKDSLDALGEHVLPALLRSRRNGGQRLRIWSAGCCTGEEAYSLAILLDGLIPDPAAWNISILATDINPGFLRKAAEGVYGDWSFRGTPEWVRQRYFRKCQDGRLQLSPHIRARVTFSYLNLAADVYPSLVNNSNAMDVILCRNVLMYFTADQARKTVAHFRNCLVDGGWLMVSPTETSNSLFPGFSPVEFRGAFFYRKSDGTGRPIEPGPEIIQPAPAADAPDPWQPIASAVADDPGRPVPVAFKEAEPLADDEVEPPSDAARRCANQGRLAEAFDWCAAAIAADKLDPAHYYLQASIEQELGRTDAAVRSLLRALYLDSGFVLARFALGNLELSQGRRRQAERHFAHTLALLRGHADDALLPEAEGLTAGRLAEIVSSVLASLPREERSR
ncbi:MAG TPA: CheR family methyltransferase [Rhodocyclaceae bacterium]|nr:CheR family methyltransferase [Rhodocyclaceae bacterium]